MGSSAVRTALHYGGHEVAAKALYHAAWRFYSDRWLNIASRSLSEPLCAEHPARNQLLVGIARWATDVRRRTGSQSAAQTAQRFARGETAVDLYE